MKTWEVIELLASLVKGKYPCPSGAIGQLILEVGFELKTPKDIVTGRESYNLGNIKGVGPAGSVVIYTREYYTQRQVDWVRSAGKLVRIVGPAKRNPALTEVLIMDTFKAYHNYGESIDDQLQLLKNPRYVRAGVWEAKTPEAYADALKKAGYATDPAYVEKIMAIVRRYQLTRFDVTEEEAEIGQKVDVFYNDMTASGQLLDSLTWVPARVIGQAAGALVDWDGKQVLINGAPIETRLIHNTGFVPVRRLAEALGLRVEWDKSNKTVTLLDPI